MSENHNPKYKLDFGAGWYDLENDGRDEFRWMKKNASCFFSGLDDSFVKVLKITAGHLFPDEKNPILSIKQEEKLLQNTEIAFGVRDYFIPLDPTKGNLHINLKLNKTFDSEVTKDPRTLGILVKKIELLHLFKGTYLFGTGWYSEEDDDGRLFRWTDKEATILSSNDLINNHAFLQFDLESPFKNLSQILEISFNGQSIAEFLTLHEWISHVINLSAVKEKLGLDKDPKKNKSCVEIKFSVNNTFIDKVHKFSFRRLGIKISDIRFHNNEHEYKIFQIFQNKSPLDSLQNLPRKSDFQKIKSYNFNKNLHEAKKGLTSLKSLPISLYVDVNLKCNLMCPSCFRSSPEYKGRVWPTMDFKLFEKIAHYLFPTAYKVNLSGGGESILHKDFEKMIELCSYYQVRPLLYTNAMTLTRKKTALLARSGTVMGISIDGASQDTFERLRYPAKWEKIISRLDMIKDVREEINNDEFYPYFGVVIQKSNTKELTTFVEMAHHYHFDLIKFSRLDIYYPELKKEEPDIEETHRELEKALEIATNKGIRLYVPNLGEKGMNEKLRSLIQKNESFPQKMDKNNPDRFVKYPSLKSKYCQIPWSETLITPEGKVNIGCCSGFELGDITKNHFKDIWNNRTYRKLRRTVNSKKPMSCCKPDVCHFRK